MEATADGGVVTLTASDCMHATVLQSRRVGMRLTVERECVEGFVGCVRNRGALTTALGVALDGTIDCWEDDATGGEETSIAVSKGEKIAGVDGNMGK